MGANPAEDIRTRIRALLHAGGQSTLLGFVDAFDNAYSAEQVAAVADAMAKDGELLGSQDGTGRRRWTRGARMKELAAAISPPPAAPIEKPTPPPAPATHPAQEAAPVSKADTNVRGEAARKKIIAGLAGGPQHRNELAAAVGLESSAVGYHLKRMKKDRLVVQRGGRLGPWQLRSDGSADEAPAKVAGKRGSKPAKNSNGHDALTTELERLSQKLAPIQKLPAKVSALDRLATIAGGQTASLLAEIRADLERVGGATA